MQALRAEDPETLGGHRLLARLGAGGMGTVYLARTAEGTPVALKVIRAGFAADPAFRARFRREVRLATGLTGRWVVAVTAADPEAREPWLATAFVPGPSLAEAVDALGPLPVGTVVALGARLAEALGELHAVGLVHRDVKPGNILLAPDGPRLIDFGIAKDAGVTALTAHDAVVGTPGYLAPEQARTHGGEAGPASDMFSLGCVLAYAATGRRPFGTGEPAAVLYRTVHEPPDLTGLDRLPHPLYELITACLAKNPARRPPATALHHTLTTGTAPPHSDDDHPATRHHDGDSADSGRDHGLSAPGRDGGALGLGRGGRAADPGGDGGFADGGRDHGPSAAGRDGGALGLGRGGRPADPGWDGGSVDDGSDRGPTAPIRHGGTPDPGSGGRPADPGRSGRSADGGRDHGAPGPHRDGRLPDPGRDTHLPRPAEDDWLPPAVLRLVAERSARALDPPPRAEPSERPDTDDPRGPTRRRVLAAGGSAAAVLAVSGGATAVLLNRRNATTGGARHGTPTRTLALQADLTGTQKAVGQAQEHGVRLAVAAHNAREDAAFRLALTVHNDGGDAARARDTARRLLAQPSVLAVVGPTTIATAAASVPLYCAESMPVVLVSVDSGAAALTSSRLRSLCVTRASDDARTLPLVSYLTVNHPSTRTAVVEDEAAGAVSRSVSRELSGVPPHQGTVTVHRIAAGTSDFGPAVARALATEPQAVVYAGTSPARAAACARALTAAHFTGAKATIDPVMTPAFLTAAGQAAEGWVFGAPFTEPQSVTTKAAKAFTAAHRARYGSPPGRWSAEAYDAVGLIARALTALGPATTVDPGQIAERLFRTPYTGIAKPLTFAQDGTHQLSPPKTSFLYQVKNAAFHFLGRYDQVH